MPDKENKDQKEENQENMNHSMNLAIVGGVVGAGIGLISSPGTSKKVMKSLNESEFMKMAGRELKRSVQELITEHALSTIRQTASGFIAKSSLPKEKNDNSNEKNNSSQDEHSSQYEEIKEDNKSLNERLDRIENMLNELVDSKK